MDIKSIKTQVLKEIHEASDLKTLDNLEIKYLGRKGQITTAFASLKNLSAGERKKMGALLNRIKAQIEERIKIRRAELKTIELDRAPKEWIDVTVSGIKPPKGHLHPRTTVMRQVENIFQAMGFSIVEGPELETDWYNFEALNIPKDHPSRDMQDTFYVPNPAGGADLIMRTHTSPVQVRFMEKNNPPLRIIVPGKVFRNEATDASHDYQFYQVEGLLVDKHISVAHFKAVIAEFFYRFYKQKVPVRLRPSYFPFTEPSFEIDIGCIFCHPRTISQPADIRGKQKGCRVCSHTGWLEVAGAGMVNQSVFEAAGYARNEWQGFAFGFGFERLVMMKYKIDDIRLLNSGDLRFLNQF